MEHEETLGFAKETDKQNSTSKERIENKQINDTPFVARRFDEEWTVTVGNYKVKQGLKSFEECEEATKDISWTTLTTVMQAIVEANMPNGQRVKLYKQLNKAQNEANQKK